MSPASEGKEAFNTLQLLETKLINQLNKKVTASVRTTNKV